MANYVELVRNLTIKELKIRYRNSILGFFWSLLNPLAMMVILTLVFSILLKSKIENFSVFLLTALLTWRFFSISTSTSLQSIVGNSSLITKVYFPRWLLVLSNSIANLISISLEFVTLFPLMIFFKMPISFPILLLPLILILELILILGLSFGLSALNVYYRDVSQIWDLSLQAGFFICPILYDITFIPAKYHSIYLLNPMANIIIAVRNLFYHNILPSSDNIIYIGISSFLILIIGFLVFQKFEPRFAEVV